MPWTVVAVILAEMALLGLVLWLVAVRVQERARWRFELQARVLERFSSPAELQQFLESEGGRRLLATLTVRRSPDRPALLSIHAGVVLFVVGLVLFLSAAFRLGGRPADADLMLGGAVVLAVGLGLLLAGAVSHRLGRAWGLVPAGRPPLEMDAAAS